MSHFVVITLLPEKTKDINKAVDDALAPYSEKLEVKEYLKKCYCVGNKAEESARKAADKKFGTIDDLRESFNETISKEIKQGLTDIEVFDNPDIQEKLDIAWKNYLKPHQNYEKKCFGKHKLKNTPDPKCEECKGSGKYSTTSNPNGKWDWYGIGGRWTGFLTDYDPYSDPRNEQICYICFGTGLRMDELGISQRMKDPNYKCNGCGGTGKMVKFASEFKKHDGDIIPAKEWLKQLNKDVKKYTPFAVVTPDGKWIERGNMGWFACVSNEKDKDRWSTEVLEIAKKYAENCVAVVCDCHV